MQSAHLLFPIAGVFDFIKADGILISQIRNDFAQLGANFRQALFFDGAVNAAGAKLLIRSSGVNAGEAGERLYGGERCYRLTLCVSVMTFLTGVTAELEAEWV